MTETAGVVASGDQRPPVSFMGVVIPRRAFEQLCAYGVLAVVAGKLSLDIATEMAWPYNETGFHVLPECAAMIAEPPAKAAAIGRAVMVCQGTGRIHARPYCERVAYNAYHVRNPDNSTLMMYADLANYGATEEDWAVVFSRAGRYVDELDVVGISGGMASALGGLRTVKKWGRNLHMRLGVFINGVTSEDDFANRAAGESLARLAGASKGTVLDKGLMNIGEQADRGELDSYLDSPVDWVRRWWFDATHGSPPPMTRNQMEVMENMDTDRDWRDWQGIIDENTRLLYVRLVGDKYVNNDASIARLGRLAARLGATLEIVDLPVGTPHADMDAASHKIRPWVEQQTGIRPHRFFGPKLR